LFHTKGKLGRFLVSLPVQTDNLQDLINITIRQIQNRRLYLPDGDVPVSYQLLPGKATTRNAIRLLSIMGYQENIIQKAEQMALEFVRNSHWQMLD